MPWRTKQDVLYGNLIEGDYYLQKSLVRRKGYEDLGRERLPLDDETVSKIEIVRDGKWVSR